VSAKQSGVMRSARVDAWSRSVKRSYEPEFLHMVASTMLTYNVLLHSARVAW
jgi:hypothetical protein